MHVFRPGLTKVNISRVHACIAAAALLLPCNECVWEEDGGSVVSIAKPAVMFDLVKVEALAPVAADADARLQKALDQVVSRS